METLKAIFTRRSIRKYSGGTVTDEQLEVLLRAAMHAPSARNKQPWHFVVITDKDILYKLGGTHPYGKMLMDAGAAIVTCGDKTIEEMDSYLLQNCSAATQNLLLAAHDLGLGAVWLGLHPREDRISSLKAILKFPDHILPVSMISLGSPDEVKEGDDRFLADRIHENQW
jgi:nitroreductase